MHWIFSPLMMAAMAAAPSGAGKPELLSAGAAAPDVIAITIRAQAVEHGEQIPYRAQPGDELVMSNQHRYIRRGETRIGALVGKEGKILQTVDRLVGDPLDLSAADRPDSYRIVSEGGASAVPAAAYRKSKPVDCVRGPAPESAAMEHTIILRLAHPLEAGRRYAIRFRDGLLAENEFSFAFDPLRLLSEAVHVNQIGFRPDDPAKLAFLSFWMGTGGGLAYPEGLAFHVVDAQTAEPVFSGKAVLARRAADPANKTKADIHRLDFSALRTPGVYRVSVEGVGCSFAFEIGEEAWKKAFIQSMRGLFCQRSGIALGPPHTPFVRPRAFHPEDGVTVYVSEPRVAGEDPSIRDLGPELEALVASANAKDRFKLWLDDLTNRTLPNAWGGYMDAGDWDRRPDHTLMPLAMFDLAELFPDAFAGWDFNIPESDNGRPDLIDEAFWLVDFLRRMQQEDGSVYSGIESGAHPRRGECSWQESLPVFAYSRNRSSAYHTAAVGARAALWLQSNGLPEDAQDYREAALKAFLWAESQPDAPPPGGAMPGRGTVQDDRCLAAAELFRLTGEAAYNDIFLGATRFSNPGAPFYTSPASLNNDPQGEAGWTYLRAERPEADKAILQNIRAAMKRDADRLVQNCEATDFCWAGGPNRPLRWGALSMPESQALCRAHFILGDEKYLRAIVLSTLTGAGANPVNMCYVTGVGTRWPQHPLHEDAYNTRQPLYEGVTIGGPIDPASPNKHVNSSKYEAMMTPPSLEWPATESYYDVFQNVPMNEFTVHQTMLPTSFVWGYLAARPRTD